MGESTRSPHREPTAECPTVYIVFESDTLGWRTNLVYEGELCPECRSKALEYFVPNEGCDTDQLLACPRRNCFHVPIVRPLTAAE